MPFFRKTPVLSTDLVEWQVSTYQWLLEQFGGRDFYEDTVLVEPTDEFFPDTGRTEEETAEKIFARVKKYANMEDWPCKLVAGERDPNPVVTPTTVLKGAPVGPAGTFSARGRRRQKVEIRYKPGLVRDPENLVATFAHELSHYLTATATQPPPDGWDDWEHATDLASVFLGFGVFMANSAFVFKQFTDFDSQGWSYQQQGYLSQEEFLYALAIFTRLKDVDKKRVVMHLNSTLRGYYKKALKELDSNPGVVDKLKRVKPLESE